MKFFRAFPVAAIAIVAVHVWVLASLGTSREGVLWSNSLQLAAGLLAAAAFGAAARRAQGLVRDACLLTAFSFALWSVAQAGWLHHELTQAVVVPTGSLINILFFFAFAPLMAALFLPLRPQRKEEIWPLALDTIQLGIALVSAYLFFFYTPSFLQPQAGVSEAAMRQATEVRNWLIFLALLAASASARTREGRSLLVRLAVVFFLYSAGMTVYFHSTPTMVIHTGKWFDLTWTISFATAAVLAGGVGTGKDKAAAEDAPAVKPSWAFYAMPAFLPLVTWLMALRVGRDQFAMAATVVGLSFLCYTARLFLTHINLQRATQAVRDSENKFALAFKQSSSPVVISSLTDGRFLEVNDAFVGFYGAPRQEIVGKTALELGLWLDPDQRERGMQELQAQGRVRDFEAVIRPQSGELRTVLFSADVLEVPPERWLLVTLNDITEARRAEEERVHLLGRLISAEEEERRRIAGELHDGTGQALTSLLLQLRALQQAPSLDKVRSDLDLLRKSTADAVEDLRRISRGLHPSVLDDFGLVPALRRMVEDTGAAGKLKVSFSADGLEQLRLPRAVEVAVYRTAQEALNNAVKHAAAKAVQVSLRQEQEALQVVVSDDGAGFDVEATLQRAARENRLGLLGIRQRMELLGGSAEILSRPGEGTTARLLVPMNPARSSEPQSQPPEARRVRKAG